MEKKQDDDDRQDESTFDQQRPISDFALKLLLYTSKEKGF